MATEEQVQAVRRMAGEPTTETYTDEAISALFDGKGSAESAAAVIWQEKAGKYAALVNTSESGSSRSMSQLHTNALNMAKYYAALVPGETEGGVVDTTNSPMTIGIDRV